MVPDDGEVVGGEVTVEGFFDAGLALPQTIYGKSALKVHTP
jgi:hypothetical protein